MDTDLFGLGEFIFPVCPRKCLYPTIDQRRQASLHETDALVMIHRVPPDVSLCGLLDDESSMISLVNLTNLLCGLRKRGATILVNSARGSSQGLFKRIGN